MLRLRPYKHEDSIFIKRWITDERLCHQWCATNFIYPLDDKQLERYASFLEKSANDLAFTAISQVDEIVIGHIKLGRINFQKGMGALQFVIIGDEKYKSKGYGQELVRLAVLYAFELLKLKKITLRVFAFNTKAINCYKAVGFHEVQYLENSYSFKDEQWDEIVMEIEKN